MLSGFRCQDHGEMQACAASRCCKRHLIGAFDVWRVQKSDYRCLHQARKVPDFSRFVLRSLFYHIYSITSQTP